MRRKTTDATTSDEPQPSLVTMMLVAERYGTRVSVPNLAKELGLAVGTVNNQISAGIFPVPTYKDTGGRFADYRDLALYIDKCRQLARAA